MYKGFGKARIIQQLPGDQIGDGFFDHIGFKPAGHELAQQFLLAVFATRQ